MSHERELDSPALVAAQAAAVQPELLALGEGLCVIGRAPGCAIVVSHPLVSRHHARVQQQGTRYVLIDTESANGTFVNGSRLVAPHALIDGDQIGLGRPALVLSFIDPDATQRVSSPLTYNERALSFFAGPQRIELAPMQLKLLRHLYKHAGDTCTRESCAEAVWGREYEPGRDAGALDQALNSLRRTLEEYGLAREIIETRRGLGYLLKL